MQEIPAALLLFMGVFREPSAHLLIGPVPVEGMRMKAVVFGPGIVEMLDEVLRRRPGCSFQVTRSERLDQQLGLVEPRCVSRSEAGTPPVPPLPEVIVCQGSGVT